MKSSRFVASTILTAAAVGLLSSVALAGESSSRARSEEPTFPDPSLEPKYVVPYARSDSDPTRTETVITLHNMGRDKCEADVRYYNRNSNQPRGFSATDLQPHESKEFVTYNEGEVVEPYVANAYRNYHEDFEGYAVIHTDCHKDYFAYNATLVVDIDHNRHVGGSYTSLKVKKYQTGSHGGGSGDEG